MRRSGDFSEVVRRGVRSGTSRVVVHLLGPTGQATVPTSDPAEAEVLVGFVVPRAVGGAVVRNRVKRRLRALMAPRLSELPAGGRVVVRALGPAATATSAELTPDLTTALRGAERKAARRAAVGTSS